MTTKFPVGTERHAVGMLSPDRPVVIKVDYQNQPDVESLTVKLWGRDNRVIAFSHDASEEVFLALSGDDLSAARFIDAFMYTVHARFRDDREAIIAKGPICLIATS